MFSPCAPRFSLAVLRFGLHCNPSTWDRLPRRGNPGPAARPPGDGSAARRALRGKRVRTGSDLDRAAPAGIRDGPAHVDGRQLKEALEPARITDHLKDLLSDAPAFIRDSKLDVNLRTYYFRQDDFDDSVSEAWAVGGALRYRSGELFERLSVGATGFTSLPLYAPPDRGGSLLLKPNQDSYSVVGELYGRLKLTDGLVATAYRHEMNTPFINKNDSRMTPNTFESYDLVGTIDLGDSAALKLAGGLGHADQGARLGALRHDVVGCGRAGDPRRRGRGRELHRAEGIARRDLLLLAGRSLDRLRGGEVRHGARRRRWACWPRRSSPTSAATAATTSPAPASPETRSR